MNDVAFSEPVILHLPGTGVRKVATSFEAVECLRNEWPQWREAGAGAALSQPVATRSTDGVARRRHGGALSEPRIGRGYCRPAAVEQAGLATRRYPARQAWRPPALSEFAMTPSTAFHSEGLIRRWWAMRTECSAPAFPSSSQRNRTVRESRARDHIPARH
jgi:hypothetical protein